MDRFKVTAPTRADLAGGTLDIWPLYCVSGGAKTVNVALDLYANAEFEVVPSGTPKVSVQVLPHDTYEFREPLSLEQVRKLNPSVRFPVAVVSSYLSQKPSMPDAEITIKISTDAPRQSGLGGSSSLCVAIARGMARVFGEFIDQGWQWRLLDWVRDMEAAYLVTPTGVQDYLAALFGGVGCYYFDTGVRDRVGYPDPVFQALSDRMLILFSGEMHNSGISNWEIFKGAFENNPDVKRGILGIKEVAEEVDSELRSGNLNWKHIGKCLNEEWHLRRTLFKVETPRLDEIINFLTEKKVIGRKVCGAAAGGSILALVDPQQKASIAEACEKQGIKVLKTSAAQYGVRATTI